VALRPASEATDVVQLSEPLHDDARQAIAA